MRLADFSHAPARLDRFRARAYTRRHPDVIGARFPGAGVLRAMKQGRLAQLVEQLTLNQRVVGSSPTSPTNDFNGL